MKGKLNCVVTELEKEIHFITDPILLNLLTAEVEDSINRLWALQVVIDERKESEVSSVYSIPREVIQRWVLELSDLGKCPTEISKLIDIPVHRVAYIVKNNRKEEAA